MDKLNIKGLVIGEKPAKRCVPISASTQEEILKEASEIIHTKAQLVEWRCDCYEDCKNVLKVVDTLKKLSAILVNLPLIFTFRTSNEGGKVKITSSEYLLLYKTAMLSKNVDLIDIEYMREEDTVHNLIHHAKTSGIAVILSHHDFDSTPPLDKIVNRFLMMKDMGAQICKVAYMPRNEEDVCKMKEACMVAKEKSLCFIGISMGELGLPTRKEASILGSSITFVAYKQESAPGQISVEEI